MMNVFLSIMLLIANAQPNTTTMTVEGVVTKFDEKIIQLKQKNGAIVIVPRSAKKKMQGVKLGKDTLRVYIGPADFLRLNPKYFEEKK